MSIKSFIKTAVISGLPSGLIMTLSFSFIGSWQYATSVGVIWGLVQGLIMSAGLQIQKNNRRDFIAANPPRLAIDEKIIFDGTAAYYLNDKKVGGWLFLTNRQLIFSQIEKDAVRQNLYFPLDEIFKVKPAADLGVFPTGLRIFGKNQLEKFVVEDRKQWSRQIEQATGLKLKK